MFQRGKKGVLRALVTVVLTAGIVGGAWQVTTLSANAQVRRMADGGYFDPTYYATHNPDVVKTFGRNRNKLYYHYTTYGKKEGRLPYEGATAAPAAPVVKTKAQHEQEAIAAINVYRKQNGKRALAAGDKTLQKAAETRAAEFGGYYMDSNGWVDMSAAHAGLPSCSFGESLAAGQRSGQSVVLAWASEPTHRNMLLSSYTRVSVGLHEDEYGRFFWSAEFQ